MICVLTSLLNHPQYPVIQSQMQSPAPETRSGSSLWERPFSSILFFLSMTLTQLFYDLILVIVWEKVGIHPEKDTIISLGREIAWLFENYCYTAENPLTICIHYCLGYALFKFHLTTFIDKEFCLFVLFFILHFPLEYFSWREMENSRLCKNIQSSTHF